LQADGRFSLKNLDSGDYYMAALIPEEKLQGKTGISGINVPDLIKLSILVPRRDLGVIQLTAQ